MPGVLSLCRIHRLWCRKWQRIVATEAGSACCQLANFGLRKIHGAWGEPGGTVAFSNGFATAAGPPLAQRALRILWKLPQPAARAATPGIHRSALTQGLCASCGHVTSRSTGLPSCNRLQWSVESEKFSFGDFKAQAAVVRPAGR